MDDDEERELWLKEKAHQRQVQYQSAQHERVEKKKKKQDPKNWGNGEKPKKNNKEKMNKTEIVIDLKWALFHENFRKTLKWTKW